MSQISSSANFQQMNFRLFTPHLLGCHSSLEVLLNRLWRREQPFKVLALGILL
jgi:hypothetical protein